MKYFGYAFDDPARDLACDEALLELMEEEENEPLGHDLLRVWEPARYFVVLGHANTIHAEVNLAQCKQNSVPILRRMSGGGAVLQGPGCLNYALFLSNRAHRFRHVSDGFRYVLERHRAMIENLTGMPVSLEGISDLTIAGRKFSGNAQYRKSRAVLVHGTFLIDFDFNLVERYLRLPMRQPTYRHNRPHVEFLTKLALPPAVLRENLKKVWRADQSLDEIPRNRIETLVRERYGRKEWSEKF